MSINKLFAVLQCQRTTPNRLRGEARNGRRAIYVDRSRRPDGDLRDKPGCVPASGCTKGAPCMARHQVHRSRWIACRRRSAAPSITILVFSRGKTVEKCALEELEKHGMLIWKGSRRVPFPASRGLRWGPGPQSNGTKGARGTPLHPKASQPAPGGGGGKCTRGRRKAPRWLGSSPSRRISDGG